MAVCTCNMMPNPILTLTGQASSLRRLIKDHALLRNDPPPNYLFPDTDDLSSMPDDLTQLIVLVTGAHGTPYSQGLWRLHLRMPQDYPRNPPKATFKTRIYHPNVDENTGAVCLETLKRDWDPKLTLKDILVTISCLLIQPNPDSALNAAAGALIQEDYDAFSKQAQLMTRIHAPIPQHLRHQVGVAKKRGEDDLPVVGSNTDVLQSQCCSQPKDAQEDDTKENEPRPMSTEHLQANTKNKRPLADLLLPQESDEGTNPEHLHPQSTQQSQADRSRHLDDSGETNRKKSPKHSHASTAIDDRSHVPTSDMLDEKENAPVEMKRTTAPAPRPTALRKVSNVGATRRGQPRVGIRRL